ncbi:Predicted SAM-dependent methyltransferase [Rhodobacterales bacterium HTCC2150]|nr:Predicted SAM-dependent methyltransferase [Rhodobacterales bacterium HTCC2150] [Rhodobacteraceae bacterium HTCC2150]
MNQPPYPVVRLKPKLDSSAIRYGAPWVFANELVTDRRTRALDPGAIAVLEDSDRRPIGVVTVNNNSKIIGRILDRNPAAVIDEAWLTHKLTQAAAMRDRLFSKPFYRLIHAEADGLPGVIIDRFGDIAVIQPNAAWAEMMMDQFIAALQTIGIKSVVKSGTGRARKLEGLVEEMTVPLGSVTAKVPVAMNGATYMADLIGGQKTGIFYDQRPNHAFAAGLSKDVRVLDVFSHVGGFSLAALANGAKSALAVDGSTAALALAQEGAEASGVADRFETRCSDAFDALTALAAEGQEFEVVICDPPAFAPNKKAAEAGLRAYEKVARLATALVADGGYLGLCSCSHAVDLTKFRMACSRGIGRAGGRAQLIHTGYAGADHPMHPQLAESGYLKSLFYRMIS